MFRRPVSTHLALLLFGILGALLVLAWRELALQPDGKLHVHFLDVGQGDATLISTPSGKQILIDGGPNMDTLEQVGRFMPFFDRTIELLVLSHPHDDHLTALPALMQRYRIDLILLGGADQTSGRYASLLHLLTTRHIPVVLADPEKHIAMKDGTVLDVLWPQTDVLTTLDTNNTSVVVRVRSGKWSFLFPGDIEEEAERALLQAGAVVRADALKVPHHGSRTSSFTGFLLAVKPALGIVSSGAENSFGHPHAETVKRYEKMGIPLRFTAKEGTISLTFPPETPSP